MFGIHDYKKISISLVFNYLWNHFTLQSLSWQNKYPVALIEVCMAVTIILSCSKTNFMFSFHNYYPAWWTELVQKTSRQSSKFQYKFTFTIEIKFFNRRSQVGSSLALTKVDVCGGWGRRLPHYLVRMTWIVKKINISPYYRQCQFSTKSLSTVHKTKLNFFCASIPMNKKKNPFTVHGWCFLN